VDVDKSYFLVKAIKFIYSRMHINSIYQDCLDESSGRCY